MRARRARVGPLLAALWLAAGCADIIELQYDPVGDTRPTVLVERLRTGLGTLRDTYRFQRAGGYGPTDFLIDELAKAATAMDEDLRRQGGQFGAALRRARDVGRQLAPLVEDSRRVDGRVRAAWRPVRDALNDLVSAYLGQPDSAVYRQEAVPKRTLPSRRGRRLVGRRARRLRCGPPAGPSWRGESRTGDVSRSAPEPSQSSPAACP